MPRRNAGKSLCFFLGSPDREKKLVKGSSNPSNPESLHEPEFELRFEIPNERLDRVKKQLLDYIRLGLNVRRNILYDPERAVVRVVEWSKAPTATELAPEFRETPIGRLIVSGCTIEDIELAEPVRGLGLGRAIVEKLKEELRRRGCKEVWVARVAPMMSEFWKKLGVRVIGE